MKGMKSTMFKKGTKRRLEDSFKTSSTRKIAKGSLTATPTLPTSPKSPTSQTAALSPYHCPFNITKEDDVFKVRLIDSPFRDLWNGSRLVDGRRGLTHMELQHLLIYGQMLRNCLKSTGKILFVSWFDNTTCDDVISQAYGMEAKAPRKPGRQYTPANLFNDPHLSSTSPEFLRRIKGDLTRQQFNRLKDLAFPGFEFGAEQICPIYNLEAQWKLRGSAYPLSVAIHGRTDLFCDIERRSHKTGFAGARAKTKIPSTFPHIDTDPDKLISLHETKDDGLDGIQGLVFLSDVPDYAPGFAYVPGSHERKFWAELKQGGSYPYLFQGRTKPPFRSIVKIDGKKPDPQKFRKMDYDGGRLKKLGAVPQGSYFLWTETSLHALVGSRPGKPGVIRHAQYLSFTPRTDPHCSGY